MMKEPIKETKEEAEECSACRQCDTCCNSCCCSFWSWVLAVLFALFGFLAGVVVGAVIQRNGVLRDLGVRLPGEGEGYYDEFNNFYYVENG